MLAEPIRFTGNLTYTDLVYLDRVRLLLLMRPSLWIFVGGFSGLIMGTLVAVGLKVGFTVQNCVFLGIFSYLPFGWLLTHATVDRCRIRRQAESLEESTAILSDDSISVGNAVAGAHMPWNRLAALIDTPRGLVFVIGNNQIWFYLPDRVFVDSAQRGLVMTAAREHKVTIRTID